MELNSYFKSLKAYSDSKTQRSSKFDTTGTLLDLTNKRNIGSVIVRPISDARGIPTIIMTNLYEIHETNYKTDESGNLVLGDDGKPVPIYSTVVVASPDNYTSDKLKLDATQIGVLQKAMEAAQKYKEYCDEEMLDSTETPTNLWIKKLKEVTIFYGKVISVITDAATNDDGNTRCLIHKSSKFFSDLSAAIDATTTARRDGGAWMAQYFGRDIGNSTRLLSITTALNKPGTIGYSNTIAFTEGAEYSLTQKDIDTANDIYANPYCDVTTFNSEILKGLTDRINSYIAKVDAQAAAASGLVPTDPQPTFRTIDNPPVVENGFHIPTGTGNPAPQASVGTASMMPPPGLVPMNPSTGNL